jgi:hypothetical protein
VSGHQRTTAGISVWDFVFSVRVLSRMKAFIHPGRRARSKSRGLSVAGLKTLLRRHRAAVDSEPARKKIYSRIAPLPTPTNTDTDDRGGTDMAHFGGHGRQLETC